MKIALIGVGNLARSLIHGFLSHGIKPEQLILSNPNPQRCEDLQAQHQLICVENNIEAARDADVIFLCVKPKVMPEVVAELSALDWHQQLVVSVAAGVTIEQLRRLDESVALVRAMPNIGAQVSCSATSCFGSKLNSSQQTEVTKLLQTIGDVYWLEREDHIDAATALAGSGPAYYFYILEAMQKAASELGLQAHDEMILQTMRGALRLAENSMNDLKSLRESVTSPGGTTAAALNVFVENDLQGLIQKAITAAYERAHELAKGE